MKAALFLLAVALGSQLIGCSHRTPSTPIQSSDAGAQLNSDMEASAMYRHLNKLRENGREEVLKALTQDHQHLVSQLFGQLAVAQKPDVVAAARKLDSALTPKEKQSIMNASTGLRQQYIALTERLRQQMTRRGEHLNIGYTRITRADPGIVLLLLLTENLSFETSKAARGSRTMF